MQSKVKLTKRQVKEDKFTTFMLTSKGKVQDNWQFWVIGLVVVVLMAAAAIWFADNRAKSAQDAAEMFSRAMVNYRNGDNQVAIMEFNEVMNRFGGSEVADNATYFLGNVNLANRSYDEAIRAFETYLGLGNDNLLNRASALAGIAVAHEDQGNFAEAAAFYVKSAEEYPEGPQEADSWVGAVRNLVAAGDMAAAQSRLEVLKDRFEGSESLAKATRLMAEKSEGAVAAE